MQLIFGPQLDTGGGQLGSDPQLGTGGGQLGSDPQLGTGGGQLGSEPQLGTGGQLVFGVQLRSGWQLMLTSVTSAELLLSIDKSSLEDSMFKSLNFSSNFVMSNKI